MTKKDIKVLLARLDEHYAEYFKCYLDHRNAWELLVATILSAQCTDARVNIVTPALFERFKDRADFASAELELLEEYVKQTGFYHMKAKHIKACAQMILEEHGGQVPSEMDKLTRLPGVGRKTANVVRGHIFDLPGIIVDTHVSRISQKIGITKQKDPVKIEFDLMDKLPEEHWLRYNTQIIAHGRTICTARSPKCAACFLADICATGKQT